MTQNRRLAESIARQPCLDLRPDGEINVNQYGNHVLPRSEASQKKCAANAYGRAKRKKARKA